MVIERCNKIIHHGEELKKFHYTHPVKLVDLRVFLKLPTKLNYAYQSYFPNQRSQKKGENIHTNFQYKSGDRFQNI